MSFDCINYYDKQIPIPDSLKNQDDGYNALPWTKSYIPQPYDVDYNQYRFKQCIGVKQGVINTSTLNQWTSVWNNTDVNSSGPETRCINVFIDYIYSGNEFRTFNEEHYNKIKDAVEYLLSSYYNQEILISEDQISGHKLVDPNVNYTSGYSSLQENFVELCAAEDSIPGICSLTQLKFCNTCTRNSVTNRNATVRLCGCYVQKDDRFDVPYQCDPLCVQEQISKKAKIQDGVLYPDKCLSDVCVMNDISINSYQSNIKSISFTQVCPQCTGERTCICIIDTSIAGLANVIGIADPITFNQYCGSNSVCLVTNPSTLELEEVQCKDALTDLQAETFYFPVPTSFWVIVIICFLIFIILIVTYYFTIKYYKT